MQITDNELYAKCKEYGLNARLWRRKFAGLLPEVDHRRLHRKKGFASIYEFAFKLCGMSQRSVDKVLNLSEKLADKPLLREQLESGAQSWSKIEVVASVAKPETDKEWAEKVDRLSFRALRTYVIESQRENLTEQELDSYLTGAGQVQNDFEWSQLSFKLKRELEHKLRVIKRDLEKEKKEALTFGEVIEHLLENQGSGNPVAVIKVCPECAKKKGQEATTRHIPQQVQNLLRAKYQDKCVFRGCNLPSTSWHHTRRFALESNHDPDFIVPLCVDHERLVHSGLINHEEKSPQSWRTQNQPDIHSPKFQIDSAVQKQRRHPNLVK